MDSGVMEIQIKQFLLIYLLLLVILAIMKRGHVKQGKYMFLASMKMSVQLILSGLVLTYIMKNPHPIFTVIYLSLMIFYTIYRVLRENRDLNNRFKVVTGFTVTISGLLVMIYFICIVVGKSIFDPQYAITISGMLMGNTMTGSCLAVKTFRESLEGQSGRINALLCAGAAPGKILRPFAGQALETALLPTLNRMMGMGIVSLPGMMTGQIIAGTLPITAIMYQISVMIAICAVVSLSSYGILFIGSKTLYDKETQIIELPETRK